MGKKYQSMDVRTGHKEGEVVELTDEELNKLPFNVFMKLVDGEKEEDKEKIEEAKKQKDEDDLRVLLLGKVLSTQRAEKVVEKYGCEEALKKNVDKAGIDEVTDEFLKKEFELKSKGARSKVDGKDLRYNEKKKEWKEEKIEGDK